MLLNAVGRNLLGIIRLMIECYPVTLFFLLLIISLIGLLKAREWGRRCGLVVGVIIIFFGLQVLATANLSIDPQEIGINSFVILIGVGIIYYLTRPKIKALFIPQRRIYKGRVPAILLRLKESKKARRTGLALVILGLLCLYLIALFQGLGIYIGPPPAKLEGVVSDRGIDTNGNGLYDWLEIEISAEIYKAGDYRLNASLYSMDGQYICGIISSVPRNLKPGKHLLLGKYDGEIIAASEIDGPYKITKIWIYKERWSEYIRVNIVKTSYITAPYKASQFE